MAMVRPGWSAPGLGRGEDRGALGVALEASDLVDDREQLVAAGLVESEEALEDVLGVLLAVLDDASTTMRPTGAELVRLFDGVRCWWTRWG